MPVGFGFQVESLAQSTYVGGLLILCRYCESEVEKFCSPGDFNLICEDSCHVHSLGHHIYRNDSLSDSGSMPKRLLEKI